MPALASHLLCPSLSKDRSRLFAWQTLAVTEH